MCRIVSRLYGKHLQGWLRKWNAAPALPPAVPPAERCVQSSDPPPHIFSFTSYHPLRLSCFGLSTAAPCYFPPVLADRRALAIGPPSPELSPDGLCVFVVLHRHPPADPPTHPHSCIQKEDRRCQVFQNDMPVTASNFLDLCNKRFYARSQLAPFVSLDFHVVIS